MKKWIAIGAVGMLVLAVLGIICVFGVLYPLKDRTEIISAATEYAIDPVLVAAIINTESSFDQNKVSSKQAVGLMQILPSTAVYIADDGANLDLFDAATNIQIGVKYLAYLINKFGDIDTALFAYNAGEGNVARWLVEQNVNQLTKCPFPETNAYVAKIKRSMKFYHGRLS